MSWYNPFSWGDQSKQQQDQIAMIRANAQQAAEYADSNQEQGYALGQRGNGALDYMQGQMQGQNSVSALQLRQALQQNLAAQQSMAASANPANAAMAARTAAIQMGQMDSGLAGQQAVAGLQERNQAAQQYSQLLMGLRGQDVNAALQSRANAIHGYGGYKPEGSDVEKFGPAVVGLGGALITSGILGGGPPGVGDPGGLTDSNPGQIDNPFGPGDGTGQGPGDGTNWGPRRAPRPTVTAYGAAPPAWGSWGASDKRLKKNVRPADDDANDAARKLPAFAYAYKDKRFGEGKQLGPMAQDLEKAGLGHTVVNTPGGKVVNGAKLSLANTAMVSAMARRLDALEKKAG